MPDGDIETIHMDGKWHNVVGRADQVSEPFDSRDDAVREGQEMARELKAEHIIKNVDGSIDERHSYGDDAGAEERRS